MPFSSKDCWLMQLLSYAAAIHHVSQDTELNKVKSNYEDWVLTNEFKLSFLMFAWLCSSSPV